MDASSVFGKSFRRLHTDSVAHGAGTFTTYTPPANTSSILWITISASGSGALSVSVRNNNNTTISATASGSGPAINGSGIVFLGPGDSLQTVTSGTGISATISFFAIELYGVTNPI